MWKWCFTGQYIIMAASPTGIYIGICIVRPNWGIECFWNWGTILMQTDKQIESQSSFNKRSGGPKNKEQDF